MVTKKKKKIIIIGCKGQLGAALSSSPWPDLYTIYPLDHSQLDITDKYTLETKLYNLKPDCLINTAVYGMGEGANAEKSFETNTLALFSLATFCKKNNIPLVHFSTDYVFDGQQKIPYKEHDIKNPLNVYGSSKYAGELIIQNIAPPHIILRTSWIFGSEGKNFVRWVWEASQIEKELTIINDQIGCPTNVLDVVEATVKIVSQQLEKPLQEGWGSYHLCGKTPLSWYEYAKFILDEISKYRSVKLKISPISSQEYRIKFPKVILRPLYTVLDCEQILERYSITQKCWKESVKQVLKSWETP